MSAIFSGLSRSERLLPLESESTLENTREFRTLVLHQEENKALHAHVSYYWTELQLRTQQADQLVRAVGSSKVPVRGIAFPAVSLAPSRSSPKSLVCEDKVRSLSEAQEASQPSLASASPQQLGASAGSSLKTLQRYVPLISMYEKLACPTLISSALFSPLITEKPASRSWSAAPMALIRKISQLAAECSVPLQEALLFYSLTLVYFDAVLPSSTRRQPWMTGAAAASLLTQPGTSGAGPNCKLEGGNGTEGAIDAELQPCGSFQELRERLRACVAYYCQLANLRSSSNSNSVNTAGSPGSSSAAPASFLKTAVTVLLQLAAEEWEERRGATVSSANPLGSFATAVAPRDLFSTDRNSVTATAAEAAAEMTAALKGSNDEVNDGGVVLDKDSTLLLDVSREDEALSGSRRAATTATTISASTNHPKRYEDVFRPFAPRECPRDQHGFFLSPLPQDPLLCFFVPVWEVVLAACARDVHVLLRLRSRLLLEMGRRCGLLLTEERRRCDKAANALTKRKEQDVASTLSATAPTCLLPPPLLTSAPKSSSFSIYGPQGGEWRWHTAINWEGFEGQLLFCGGAAAAVATTSEPLASTAATHTRWFTDPVFAISTDSVRPVVEELADMICRIGSSLPRPASNLTTAAAAATQRLVLSRPQMDFILRALQADLIAVYVKCKRQGVQELHIRPGTRNLYLTFVQASGQECSIGSPVNFFAQACRKLHDGEAGEVRSAYASMRLVEEGGHEALAGLLLHIYNTRPGRTYQSIPLVNGGSGGEGVRCQSEGGKLNNSAALAQTPRKARLEGADLYESDSAATTRQKPQQQAASTTLVPTHVRVVTLRRAEEAVLLRVLQSHPHAAYIIGCGIQLVGLRAADGCPLLQRTCGAVVEWSVMACYCYAAGKGDGSRVERLHQPRKCVPWTAAAAEMENAAAATQQQQRQLPPASALALPPPPGVLNVEERASLVRMKGMLSHYYSSLMKHTVDRRTHEGSILDLSNGAIAGAGGDAALSASGGSAAATSSSSLAPSFACRTTLFPVDRALALYVLRHHPRYYSHLRGCGIAEVYVAAVEDHRVTAAATAEVTTLNEGVDKRMREMAHHACEAGTADTTARSSTQLGRAHTTTAAPTFVIERVCGTFIAADLEECYTRSSPHTLHPHLVLWGAPDEIPITSTMAGQKRERYV